MSSLIDDPFAQPDDQRTFIKPHARTRTSAPRPADAAVADVDDGAPDPETNARTHGLNPLLALANRLLLAASQLRTTRQVADPVALRDSLAQAIREFAERASAAGIAHERVMAARYVLCTVIDEAAADTPWGGSGVWAQHSLLAGFYNEKYGGEQVFLLMARLAEKAGANRDLLELIYAALALGFEGRYRLLDNGTAQLEAVRDRLAQIIKRERGSYSAALAQHWLVRGVERSRRLSWLPLAATAAVVLLVLVLGYAAMLLWLGARSDPVYARIQSLRLPAPVPTAAQPAPRPRLAQFLAADIRSGAVTVRDEVDRSVIVVRGDGLFASSSATLLPEREPLMARIADALAAIPGRIVVTGHTDNKPIRSALFPSNWHLSEARARSILQLLVARHVAPERLASEGRADSEPVQPNDTPAHLAMNRRVEITLVVDGRRGSARPSDQPGSAP
jgi:type VI secretion system protein ImpK